MTSRASGRSKLARPYIWRCSNLVIQKRREIGSFLGREEPVEAKTPAASLKLATQGN